MHPLFSFSINSVPKRPLSLWHRRPGGSRCGMSSRLVWRSRQQPWRPVTESEYYARWNEKPLKNFRRGMWQCHCYKVSLGRTQRVNFWRAGQGWEQDLELRGWTRVDATQVAIMRADICQLLSVPDTVLSTNIYEFISHCISLYLMKKWGMEKWSNFPRGVTTSRGTIYQNSLCPNTYTFNHCATVTEHRWAQGLIWSRMDRPWLGVRLWYMYVPSYSQVSSFRRRRGSHLPKWGKL